MFAKMDVYVYVYCLNKNVSIKKNNSIKETKLKWFQIKICYRIFLLQIRF